ncbi:MAG: hypothetical protein OXG38_01240 [Chloroflexi bacterium]|nr:hypothetical protein [Chloroflexota bacterium]
MTTGGVALTWTIVCADGDYVHRASMKLRDVDGPVGTATLDLSVQPDGGVVWVARMDESSDTPEIGGTLEKSAWNHEVADVIRNAAQWFYEIAEPQRERWRKAVRTQEKISRLRLD